MGWDIVVKKRGGRRGGESVQYRGWDIVVKKGGGRREEKVYNTGGGI